MTLPEINLSGVAEVLDQTSDAYVWVLASASVLFFIVQHIRGRRPPMHDAFGFAGRIGLMHTGFNYLLCAVDTDLIYLLEHNIVHLIIGGGVFVTVGLIGLVQLFKKRPPALR